MPVNIVMLEIKINLRAENNTVEEVPQDSGSCARAVQEQKVHGERVYIL